MFRSEQRVLADLGITQFKPLQEAAHRMLADVVANHRTTARPEYDNVSCMVALPTSSGKDLLAFSLARAFSGTVVVFHPFKALTAAADAYGMQFHCTADVFTTEYEYSPVDVLVAAYEQAHDGIVQLIQSIHRRGKLVCIFYNEAHETLPHVSGLFRDFAQIGELAPILRHSCQFPLVFVVATATLQCQHFKLLTDTLCLPSFSRLIHATPIRSNLSINLRVERNQAQLHAALVAIVLAAPCRVIVFVPAVYLCYVLKDVLSSVGRPVFSYHADLTADSKTQALRNFSSLSSILITTTALSCGLNVADVSDVVVFGECFSTEAFLQSGGRAARHGEQGSVIFLTSSYYISKMTKSSSYGSQQVLSLVQAPNFSTALLQMYALPPM
jgi:superfamily II DNA helicase RecQ